MLLLLYYIIIIIIITVYQNLPFENSKFAFLVNFSLQANFKIRYFHFWCLNKKRLDQKFFIL